MTEWGVFGVVSALVAFGVCVGAPLLRLNSNITRLNVVLELLQKQFADEKADIWAHEEKQDNQLDDHEKRIIKVEGK